MKEATEPMRILILSVTLLLSSVPSFAQVVLPEDDAPPAAPTCTPPWTSWGEGLKPCVVGTVCSDFEGFRIEPLAVHPITGKVAIRDIDKRYCRNQKPRKDVVYSNGKQFVYAECELSPLWVQEFAAWEDGCQPRVTVLVVDGGAITLRPAGGK